VHRSAFGRGDEHENDDIGLKNEKKRGTKNKPMTTIIN